MIIDKLGEIVNRTSKVKFYSMLAEDKMTTAIKNVDMWLRDVTQKLDNFALQTK